MADGFQIGAAVSYYDGEGGMTVIDPTIGQLEFVMFDFDFSRLKADYITLKTRPCELEDFQDND